MTTLIAFLFALGVLVFVHELGHYLVARWCGVKILRFSIGFGKPLLTWKVGRDQTEWSLSPIPLGGYVRMLYEEEGTPIDPSEVHRAFNRLSLPKRAAVVVAGPAANFLLAIVLYAVLGMSGLQELVLELRFTVALMRLLTLMVGRFAQSILDGSEVDAVHSLTDLCEALESGFRGLGPVLRAVGTQVAQLNDALHTVTSSLDRAARRLSQWVDLRGGGAGSSGSPVVDEVAQLASRGFPEVRSLAELAAECRGLHLPYDENIAAQRLAAVRSALAELI